MAVLDDQRRLGNGDRVSFRVVEDRKPPSQLVVADSGEMEVPLIGRVSAERADLQTARVARSRNCSIRITSIMRP